MDFQCDICDMTYRVSQRDRAPSVTRPIPADPNHPTVCIIGAGSSGLAAAKALYTAGIPFDCFEKGNDIGGNWLLDNSNGVSACYETLQINTSCARMAFSDFPMPEHYPPYASHDQVYSYFSDYVEHFGFGHRITFKTEIRDVRPAKQHGWLVEIVCDDGAETRHYDAVMVANGHHWDPRWPDPTYPGSFDGQQIHAHDYRSGDQLEGRNVVVVGAGNSAMDIAVEASYRARSSHLSIRRGQWVLKKTLFGKALDQVAVPGWAPWAVHRLRLRLAALLSGGLTKYGLPKPHHAPGESHPVQSDTIRQRLADDAITVHGSIEYLDGDRVVFHDGTWAPADLLIWATGYQLSLPFFDDAVLTAENNDLPLWNRMLHPDHPGLFFIGLLQPIGAVMPLAEAQSQWAVQILTGQYQLPDRETMIKQLYRDDEQQKARFYTSPRHTMQVDFDQYLWRITKEMRRRKAKA